ncbi:complement factor B [Ambystoma mexicanum]|uniref:complement factor B n=1 Tax=Ambystoma mexicanum TaxID=8296 RepID=UPI0037E8F86C
MEARVLTALGLCLCMAQGIGGYSLPACSQTGIDIKGGNYTVSANDKGIHKLLYKCPEGMYPYPVQSRMCSTTSGKWSTMKSPDGKTVERAQCKEIRCPVPVNFEHGDYYPRENIYRIGSWLMFECYEGYKLRNAANRTCLPNGKWSGETAICDDGTGYCPNPGQPIGSIKSGNHYRIEDRVSYTCRKELSMFGSKDRVCLESKEWSGTEPSCRQPYTFDTAEEVASSFISSLSAAIEVADPNKVAEETGVRKIKIQPDGHMNIYFILDASQSIEKEDFEAAKQCIVQLIEKIASYDITPRYSIVTFATETNVLVALEDEDATSADKVIDKLREFDYSDHETKPGTQTRLAIEKVHHMMSLHEQRNREKFKDIRHVIVLMTDGKANMGGDPRIAMIKIHNFLNVADSREDYLDVYVFGISEDVNDEEINGLASKKPGEKHVFKVADIRELQPVFDAMIDEEAAMNMCGMAKQYDKKEEKSKENNPWLATVSVLRSSGKENCKGSILTPHFILTAAHCFSVEDQPHNIHVYTNDGERYMVKKVITHPLYNINGKRPKIVEFYDYDIALVEVKEEKKIQFSTKVRPICIPCTEGTTRALRKSHPQATCAEHEATLLMWGDVDALFISEDIDKEMTREDVKIKNGERKNTCNQDALKARTYENVTDIQEVVTERFLCTGGIDPTVDKYTCKGDSGGPLLINHRNRYIQVGVISWGVVNQCAGVRRTGPTKPQSRDFHTNLFKVLPWLQDRLKDEGLQFLPLP